MAVYAKFSNGDAVQKYRAVGCQLNTPLSSGSLSGLQGVQNQITPSDTLNGQATVLDGRFEQGGMTSYERPGATFV